MAGWSAADVGLATKWRSGPCLRRDSRQAGRLLVSPTVLAQQHWRTLTNASPRTPNQVGPAEPLPATSKRTQDDLEGLKAAPVDVVVGHHQLLGGTSFEASALLVVDEESVSVWRRKKK